MFSPKLSRPYRLFKVFPGPGKMKTNFQGLSTTFKAVWPNCANWCLAESLGAKDIAALGEDFMVKTSCPHPSLCTLVSFSFLIFLPLPKSNYNPILWAWELL